MDAPRRTILVADDDEGVISMYTAAFESAGYRVMAARTGDEALRTLGTGGVHLAIIDVLIPKKNGFEVLSTVRQNSWGRDLPVILISGVFKARHHRTTVMHRYNIIEYLDKPIDVDALLTLVDKVFSRDGEALRSPSNLPPSLQSARKWMKESAPTPSVPLERGADSNLAAEQSDVESEAKAARAAPVRSAKVGMAGTFQKTPFPFVLGHVVRKKLSGAMLVERDEVKKIIYFRQGNPFLIKSNLVSECLGKLLVRERIISGAECEESLRRMKASGKPQGETLVEMGSITAGNLRFALMLQMETKLFDVFSWTAGTYRLNPSARLPPAITELDWKSLGLVVEGLGRTYDVPRAQTELAEWLHRTVALRRDYKEDLPQLELAEDLEGFVTSIESATVAEIIRRSQLEEADTYRVLYALLATGVLLPTPRRVNAMKPRYIAMAGNIGCGKSTLVDFICKHFGVAPFFEPNANNPYLKDFYADMRTWAFHSQIYFLTHKFRIHQQLQKECRDGVVVQDRTIWEDAEIFAYNLYRRRIMPAREYRLYRELYEAVAATLAAPDLLIYLRANVRTLRKRIAMRARPEEQAIPIGYLRALNGLYEDWIAHWTRGELLIVETDKLDYITDLVDRIDLLQIIDKHVLHD